AHLGDVDRRALGAVRRRARRDGRAQLDRRGRPPCRCGPDRGEVRRQDRQLGPLPRRPDRRREHLFALTQAQGCGRPRGRRHRPGDARAARPDRAPRPCSGHPGRILPHALLAHPAARAGRGARGAGARRQLGGVDRGRRASDEGDPHYTLDAASGEIRFAPLIRQPDGSARQFGRLPTPGSLLRMQKYRIGGGRIGNVGAGTIVVLRETVPYVDNIVNRHAARGGVDAEDLANALQRGPRLLKARNRAVTAEDFESLAIESSPEVARVACIQPGVDGDQSRPPAGTIAVLVLPRVPDPVRAVPIDEIRPSQSLREHVARYLDVRRLLTSRVVVSPPTIVGVKVSTELRSAPGSDPDAVRERALAALFRYCSPWTGGPSRAGWPFGRPIHVGELFAVLGAVEGVAYVESATIQPANLERNSASAAVERIEVPPTGVVCSAAHAVTVAPA
ncbi:MAG: putative baseplate assembly protein, partial [Chloroflexi bacterium]